METGPLIIWGVISSTFTYAFVVWAFAPSPPSGWELLIDLLKLIQKEL